VAQAVRYLVGRNSNYITGQVLSVSGGLTFAG
jgi:NAD(P)-dependent dehydrogenase (short-subunit alcohol dehydrogenase family)